MSDKNELVLKPISELLDKSFYIPAYQRGYRWTERQVTELLNDIKEFQQQAEEGPREAFYCLQPIVVKKHNDSWELVDGQQRLTTIFIILTCLKEVAALLGLGSYKLSYETRENSAAFLENINTERSNENIDFFHISQAKQAIVKWFAEQEPTYKVKFLQTLLNSDEMGKNVKIIWYEIGQSENATAVFTRLNVGKIPLVNAELVKALFLKSSNFSKSHDAKHLHQLSIAKEWDAIEKCLQDDAFWYFISNKPYKTNRIELVLNLASKDLCSEGIQRGDPLKTFLQFNQLLIDSSKSVVTEWLKIKQCFMTLEEWYNDRALFHLIGYLVTQDTSIDALFLLHKQSSSKLAFKKALIHKIFTPLFSPLSLDDLSLESIAEALMQLNYGRDNQKIKKLLILFNVASLLANPKTNARFQFERFKAEDWDIEHIRSVASEMPNSKDKQKVWLRNIVEYISDEHTFEPDERPDSYIEDAQKIKESASVLLESRLFDSVLFENIFQKVIELYDPHSHEEVDNSIGNLTLLDSYTNRSYQNAVFPIKRFRIIALDKQATFVPLCTKNVFLKYYSKQVDKMLFWESKDSQDHQQAIAEMVYGFLGGKGVYR
ncbi:DUF262 domain-containing HNH endonuclease family protein [Vibrio splendidus]|uniref:DUF262 domain-containing protein n=1 Tax=Vibrio TaxID=662 RepID=UPI002468A91B|nr:DUF262 domain-containing protein [Vibrio splendidus]MDH5938665.1 DUF262 domain-containing HNH endonuclease family protein [Vibrio splendidus]